MYIDFRDFLYGKIINVELNKRHFHLLCKDFYDNVTFEFQNPSLIKELTVVVFELSKNLGGSVKSDEITYGMSFNLEKANFDVCFFIQLSPICGIHENLITNLEDTYIFPVTINRKELKIIQELLENDLS